MGAILDLPCSSVILWLSFRNLSNENFSSHFSQELWGLEDWNMVHIWTVGRCIVCTGIRLLLLICPFISSLCPQLWRSWRGILVSGCPVRASVLSRTMHARVLKFHVWIPHGKIFDTHFFSCTSYLPFWSYAPLKKSKQNLMHAISYELCMVGFWNFIYGFLMEK